MQPSTECSQELHETDGRYGEEGIFEVLYIYFLHWYYILYTVLAEFLGWFQACNEQNIRVYVLRTKYTKYLHYCSFDLIYAQISDKHKQVKQAKKEAKQAKADYKATHTDKNKKYDTIFFVLTT